MTSSAQNPFNLDSALAHLADVVDQRRDAFRAGEADPKTSYTALLFSKGDDGILKKIGEEATEAVMAAKDARNSNLAPEQQKLLVGEMADLWFHCLIALSQFGLRPEDVIAELGHRLGTSGIEEKAARKAANCLFCKISQGLIPSQKVYEDEEIYAFKDINPAAPIHFLMIPKKHIPMLESAEVIDAPLLGRMMELAPHLAKQQGCRPGKDGGFRLVVNNGADGGQEVYHLHLHVMGGPRPWKK
jgi:phosphoribosyl-ATP pyrophosphohydrolase